MQRFTASARALRAGRTGAVGQDEGLVAPRGAIRRESARSYLTGAWTVAVVVLGHTGVVLHRHPVLSLLTGGYIAFVGWLTLTPDEPPAGSAALGLRILDALHRRGHLLSVDQTELEFLANVALFVPVGVFLLLLFGTRLWWLAVSASFAMTGAIEYAQRSIPGRVPDERDLFANGLGAVIGVLIGLVLTLPAALRRRRRRRSPVTTRVPVA